MTRTASSFRSHRVCATHASVSPCEANNADLVLPSIPAGCHEFLVDGGANVMIIADPALIAAGESVNVPPLLIKGIDGEGASLGAPVISLTMQPIQSDSRVPIFWQLSGGASPQANRNILPESGLWDLYHCECRKEPHMRIETHGTSIAMTRRNGLYFVLVRVRTNDEGRSCMQLEGVPNRSGRTKSPFAQVADHRHHDFQLWCARNDAHTERDVRLALNLCKKPPFKTITDSMLRTLREDEAVKLALIRRHPAGGPSSNPPTEPGQLITFDGLGPIGTPSIDDGFTYEMNGIDVWSDFSWSATTVLHTTEHWVFFCTTVFLICQKEGVKVITMRFDLSPDFGDKDSFSPEGLRAKLLLLGVLVEFAARNHPQGICHSEQNHDPITRSAESMIRRAARGRAFFLPARRYARIKLNHKCERGQTVSRYERFHGRPIPENAPTFFLFGCRAPVIRTEKERGPKGNLNRGDMATFIGIVDNKYRLLGPGSVKYMQNHMIPTDEHLILARGLTPTGNRVEVSTQTSFDSSAPVPVPVNLPKLVDSPPDLAEDLEHIRGDELRSPGFTGLPSTRTRSKTTRVHATESFYDFISTAISPNHTAALAEAFVFQVTGHLEQRDLMPAALVDSAISSICATAELQCNSTSVFGHSPACLSAITEVEACKAAQNEIEVQTDCGPRLYVVPANDKQALESPESEQWIESARQALDVLLHAGNKTVRAVVAWAVGAKIHEPVTFRKIKVNQATGQLEKNNPFKTRHAWLEPPPLDRRPQASAWFHQPHAHHSHQALLCWFL